MAELAQLGTGQLGDNQFGGENVVAENVLAVSSGIFPRNEIGFGFSHDRGYLRTEAYSPFQGSRFRSAIAQISITSINGALVGKIRTDGERSIVSSVKWVEQDRGGCRDLILRLVEQPPFEILNGSVITVNIGNTEFDWYRGVIDVPDERGTDRSIVEFRATGFFSYLRELKAISESSLEPAVFPAVTDFGEIVEILARDYIEPFSPIRYNPTKINTSTGVVTTNEIEFGKAFIDKILDVLADGSGHDWGVDGDGDLYFTPFQDDDEFIKTFFVGTDFSEFDPKKNLKEVRNAITVQIQTQQGSGQAGYNTPVGVFNDEASIAKYRKRELNKQFPGFLGTEEIDIIGNALLAEKAEPKTSARVTNMPLVDGDDYLRQGNYRFVNPLEIYTFDFSDVDFATEWSVIGAGDLSVVKDETFFVFSDGSVALEYGNAPGDRAEFTKNFKGNIESIIFYVRGYKAGSYATVGVGLTNWDENTTKLDMPVGQTFFPFEWNVSSLNLKEINKFAIRIDEDPGTGGVFNGQINIDKISLKVKGNKHYILKKKQATYTLEPGRIARDAEFGAIPPRMENYFQSVVSQLDELRFTQEIR